MNRRWIVLLLLAGLLAACNGAAEPAPLPSPQPLPTAMIAPSAEASIALPDPRVTSEPERSAVRAMTPAPIQQIQITAPLPNAPVGDLTRLQGSTAQLPFAQNLTYRVYDANETLVGEGQIQVLGEEGGPGSFIAPIRIGAAAAGAGRIEVLDLSPADGSVVARATVPVEIVP